MSGRWQARRARAQKQDDLRAWNPREAWGVSQPPGWLPSGQTPRRHSQDSAGEEIRSSPLRLKEAA